MKHMHIIASVLPVAILTTGIVASGHLPITPADFSVSRAFAAVFSYVGKIPVVNTPGLALGAYDPHGDFKTLAGMKIEHAFLPWQDVDFSSLTDADGYASARGRELLLTIEPWSWSKEWRLTPAQLQQAIAAGEYDPNIAAVCGAVGQLKSKVTVRWAHEMEDKTGQFTWSNWAPKDYIAAYRKFVRQCRDAAPNATFMWSPKGGSDMNDYYPGDEYVDSVGLSVFGLQQYDRDQVGHDRTFTEILEPGYKLAAIHGKPIVVAELGYAGDDGYVKQWAASVTQPLPDFPLLTSVVYFNDHEVYPWPNPYGLPDWRVVEEKTTM